MKPKINNELLQTFNRFFYSATPPMKKCHLCILEVSRKVLVMLSCLSCACVCVCVCVWVGVGEWESVRVQVCAYVSVRMCNYQTSLPPPPKISNNGHLYRIVITHRGGSQRISTGRSESYST